MKFIHVILLACERTMTRYLLFFLIQKMYFQYHTVIRKRNNGNEFFSKGNCFRIELNCNVSQNLFKSQIFVLSMFFLQTPQGVICIGRKQTKQVPVLPEQMSYRLEIVQTKAQDIAKKDVSIIFVYYQYFNKRSMKRHLIIKRKNDITQRNHNYTTSVYIKNKKTNRHRIWFQRGNPADSHFLQLFVMTFY